MIILHHYRTDPCRRCGASRKEVNHPKVGEKIRQLREQANLTVSEVARRMGISQPYLFDLERGRRLWTSERIERFLKALIS